MVLIAVVCVIPAVLTALWFSPLRGLLLRMLSSFHRYKFACKIQLLTDESNPVLRDHSFCVQMIGQIPILSEQIDTNVCVELTDVTESRFQPAAVLSVNEQYRCSEKADFYFMTHNGIIPSRNAVIYPWKTIIKIPASQLRFARRGRRKLLFKVSVSSCESGQVLVSDQQTVEYVTCQNGYMQLQERKMDILKAVIELAAVLGVDDIAMNERAKEIFLHWLNRKAGGFPAAGQLASWVESLQMHDMDDARQAIDCLLAYAEQTDKLEAIELALQIFASADVMTTEQVAALSGAADKLRIKKERLLTYCQKILLFSDCTFEDPAFLLGIDESLDEQSVRTRLNEEYRKWNARVTHPDEEIRRQADRILSLIAELRSRRIGAGAS